MVHCANCGRELLSNWKVCPDCGTVKEKEYTVCDNCKQIILVANPIYCVYCKNQISKAPEYIEKGDQRKERKEPKEEILVRQEMVTRSEIISSIKFELEATEKIMTSKPFYNVAIILILTASLSFSLTLTFLNWIFETNISSLDFSRGFFELFFIHAMVLLTLPWFIGQIYQVFEIKSSSKDLINAIGSYVILSFAKDLIVVLISLYIYYFEGESGQSLVSSIMLILTGLIGLYIFIQLIIIFKNRVEIGGFLSFVIISICVFFTVVLVGLYLYELVDLMIDLIFRLGG